MHARFSCSYEPPVATLSIDGELDVVSRGRLAWRLLDLEAMDCGSLRLDLRYVTYIDVGCLRLIEDARRRAAARGAVLEVAAASLCVPLVARLAGFAALAAETERLTATARHDERHVAGSRR
jgi:ABC-type transporter Mla MlaB component